MTRPIAPVPRNAVVVALVAGLAMLALACGDDGGAEPASETPSPNSQDTTTTTLTPEAEVEAAYLAHWDMLDRLGEAPDPQDPEIAERISGQALVDVVEGLRGLEERDHVSRIGPLYAHSVVSVDVEDSEAVLRDCVVDDSTVVNRTTGEVLEGGEVATALLEVTLALDDDRWKVNSVERIATQPGQRSCEDWAR